MGSFATIAQTQRAARAAAAGAVSKTADPQSYRPTAIFFLQLRQYLGLTPVQVAAHLKTHPEVIAALETGTLSRLPSWPQTHQLVWAYAAMASIDPTPALHSLQFHFVAVTAGESTPEPQAAPPARMVAIRKFLTSWMPRRWPIWRIAAVGVALMIAGLGTQSSMVEAAMTNLPAPLGGAVRYAKDAILFKTSRKFEGMTWIDVDNPRTRRADKLPIKRR